MSSKGTLKFSSIPRVFHPCDVHVHRMAWDSSDKLFCSADRGAHDNLAIIGIINQMYKFGEFLEAHEYLHRNAKKAKHTS